MDRFERYRRYLGIPLPYGMRMVIEVLGAIWEWFQEYMSQPEVMKRKLEERKERYREVDAADRVDLCDRLAFKGRLLLEARSFHGKHAWDRVLEELHVSRRTAANYTALYLFSAIHPELYKRFKVLGPTKLYRLARVAPKLLEGVTMETPIRTTDGMVPLGQATDRQLESYLRHTFPPKRRTPEERLRDAARRVMNIAVRWPENRPVHGDALEVARSAVRKASSLLDGFVAAPAGALADEPGEAVPAPRASGKAERARTGSRAPLPPRADGTPAGGIAGA